jgi:hypothetical protein
MLTVLVPATSSRLTTVARAKASLGFGAERDNLVERLIDQASATVADHCRRPFGTETVRQTWHRSGLVEVGLLLERLPVISFSTVMTEEVVLTPGGWMFDAKHGRLWRSDGAGHLISWWGTVTAEYVAGWTLPSDSGDGTLPPPIERAAILIVGAYLSSSDRDPLVKAEAIDGVGSMSWYVPGAGSGLPSPEAEQLLASYRRFA